MSEGLFVVMARFELFRNLDRQCKVAKGKLGLVLFKAFKMQDGDRFFRKKKCQGLVVNGLWLL